MTEIGWRAKYEKGFFYKEQEENCSSYTHMTKVEYKNRRMLEIFTS